MLVNIYDKKIISYNEFKLIIIETVSNFYCGIIEFLSLIEINISACLCHITKNKLLYSIKNINKAY